jgi:hypothetical protein
MLLLLTAGIRIVNEPRAGQVMLAPERCAHWSRLPSPRHTILHGVTDSGQFVGSGEVPSVSLIFAGFNGTDVYDAPLARAAVQRTRQPNSRVRLPSAVFGNDAQAASARNSTPTRWRKTFCSVNGNGYFERTPRGRNAPESTRVLNISRLPHAQRSPPGQVTTHCTTLSMQPHHASSTSLIAISRAQKEGGLRTHPSAVVFRLLVERRQCPRAADFAGSEGCCRSPGGLVECLA